MQEQGNRLFSRAAGLALALTAGLALPVSAQAQTKLLMGYYSSSAAANAREGFIPWLENVEKLSDGRLKTEFVGGGAIVKTGTTLFALRDGLVDLTNIYTPALPKELPVTTLLGDLSALMTSDMAAAGALAEFQLFNCPECQDEFSKWDMHLLSAWATPPYQLICREPINSVEDFKGKRLRTAGHLTQIATALGATPVNVSLTEVYESLQRGLVDCTFGLFVWLKDYSLGEQAKYVLTPNAGVVPAQIWVGIRNETWVALSPADRQILVDTTPAAVARVTFVYNTGGVQAIKDAESKGVHYTGPEPWLTDAIKNATVGVRDKAVARAEEAGVANAGDIADRFLATYAEWEKKVAGITNAEDYQKLLADEVYSKVDVSK